MPAASGLTAGIYTISVSDANNCGPISTTVQINQPPALSITVTGTNVYLQRLQRRRIATASVSGGVGGYTYTWSPTGGNNTTASNLFAGNYTIQVNDANGCPISANINITQPSAINLAVTPNPTICFGNSTNISANANGGTPPYSYSWNPNITTTGGPITVNPTVTTNYQVSVNDANGCTGPSSVITVFVRPPLSATGFTANLCDGQSITLYPTITSPGNNGPYTYIWSNGASSPSITVNANIALGTSNTYSVIVDDGCTNPSAIAEFTIFIYPNPVISFSADITKGCVPVNVNFTANTNSVSVSSYTWDFGNGLTATGNPVATSYTAPGVYSPTLTAESQYGCITQTVLTNYIQTYGYPTADFEADSWTVTPYDPLVNFINLSSGAVSYQWNFGDPLPAAYSIPALKSNPSHEYLYSGTYTVALIAKNEYGCADYITKVIYVDKVFSLYIPDAFTPDGNGLNDVFQPKGIGIDESDYKMLIFDRWGELVFESNNFQKGWDGSIKGSEGKATQDVYVYKIYVRDLKGNRHEFVGHVTCLPYTGDK
ncbi:MAG: hypothetical protein KatS3mg027_2292 [Bacteroidia bacterium]|nr:MAG: hypothetical protein KatS3mg027_2292 [Bacteroidia bacterium]